MTPVEVKLGKLISRCACGVHLSVNPHRDYYQTPAAYLAEQESFGPIEIEAELRKVIESGNVLVELQFYPSTPVGFFRVYHHDLDSALDMALAALDQ